MMKLDICIILGGPSEERGVSLHSAQMIAETLSHHRLTFFYCFDKAIFYKIDATYLYSNTAEDFEFKLSHPIDIKCFKEFDLVFPCIHGEFGEDGGLQKLLEDMNVPFIGSLSQICLEAFPKDKAKAKLNELGFGTPLSLDTKNLEYPCVVKPIIGGSSIGVKVLRSPDDHGEIDDSKFLVEPYCFGKEFSIVVLDTDSGPVSLVPTEIEINSDEPLKIFDYHKKYLPLPCTTFHTPATFGHIDEIRKQAASIFKSFGLSDFARIDGWIIDGKILWSDINIISGMELNSILFRQCGFLQISPRECINFIVKSKIKEECLLPEHYTQNKTIDIVLGGISAERQVSMMSGINVWSKLSSVFSDVNAFLYDGEFLWKLPMHVMFQKTVEDMLKLCYEPVTVDIELVNTIRSAMHMKQLATYPMPEKYTLKQFLSRENFVFLALHGGDGEDGTWQKLLEDRNIKFNGSDSKASALCMDKFASTLAVEQSKISNVICLPKVVVSFNTDGIHLMHSHDKVAPSFYNIKNILNADRLIIKPVSDGCSSGIVILVNDEDIREYARLLAVGVDFIPANTFTKQHNDVAISRTSTDYIIEPYIETDRILCEHNEKIVKREGLFDWIEVTVGVTEKCGKYVAFTPSVTIAHDGILSVEEKFQLGTGINLTPPPFLDKEQLCIIKNAVERIAMVLQIASYARIDVFFNIKNNLVMFIEANTLPALTPATVLFSQALCDNMVPRDFLASLV